MSTRARWGWGLAIAAVTLGWIALSLVACVALVRARNTPRPITIVGYRAAPQGLEITIDSKSPPQQVEWHSRPVPFRTLPLGSDRWQVLVPREFTPRGEFIIGVRNQAGDETGGSPYFPDRPQITAAEWDRLWSSAQ